MHQYTQCVRHNDTSLRNVHFLSNLVSNALSFYRSQNVLCRSKFFEPAPKLVCIYVVPLKKLLCWQKNQFYWLQIIFLSGTKFLWLPQYVNKCLVWHKKFGPAQNILGPLKGQGICISIVLDGSKLFWSGPNRFVWVQIILVMFKLDFSGMIFMIWTRTKQACYKIICT